MNKHSCFQSYPPKLYLSLKVKHTETVLETWTKQIKDLQHFSQHVTGEKNCSIQVLLLGSSFSASASPMLDTCPTHSVALYLNKFLGH